MAHVGVPSNKKREVTSAIMRTSNAEMVKSRLLHTYLRTSLTTSLGCLDYIDKMFYQGIVGLT